MMVVRPAKLSDLSRIQQLAQQAGVGLTTLPNDEAVLHQQIKHSRTSFAKTLQAPEDERYVFVLEDSALKTVVGTAAIIANVGAHTPFYHYKQSAVTRICNSLNIRKTYYSLSLVNDFQDATEIASLFLHPNYRRDGNGILLSRSRFLLMAAFKKRFAATIVAELRGVIDKKGHSPFWDAVGKHFFEMDFSEADRLTSLTDKQFIADLMPRNPIYISMLPKAAQKAIGKTHAESTAALKILEREGFHYQGYVDIFDAGPTISAHLTHITTVQNTQSFRVRVSSEPEGQHRFLVSNTKMDFRVVSTVTVSQSMKTKCYSINLSHNTCELKLTKRYKYVRGNLTAMD